MTDNTIKNQDPSTDVEENVNKEEATEKEVTEEVVEEVAKEETPEEVVEKEDDTPSEASEQSEEVKKEEEGEEEGEGRKNIMGDFFEDSDLTPGKTKGKQAKGTGKNWYVIHTYSGYEDAVEKSLRQRIETFNMQDYIFDIIVPKESAISIKKGSHVTEKIRMFPGYVLINMIVTDDSWYVVRNTPNVTGFVGSGTIPVPVLPEEFDRIKRHTQAEEPKYKITFQIGENVEIIEGPFKNCEGLIDDIDERKGKAKILVNVFGRETPIELEFIQIKKKL